MRARVPMDCHLLWKTLRVMNLPTAVSPSLCSPSNSSWDWEWQLQERCGKSQGSTPAVSTAVWGLPASPATAPSHAGASPWCLEFLHCFIQHTWCRFCCRASTPSKEEEEAECDNKICWQMSFWGATKKKNPAKTLEPACGPLLDVFSEP